MRIVITTICVILMIVTIFLAGFATGICAKERFEEVVAERIDDKRVLQQAGYIPPFEVDSLEPARWGN